MGKIYQMEIQRIHLLNTVEILNQVMELHLLDFGIVVDENYILKPSDVIQVSIFLEPDLEKSVRIEADGTVTLAIY